jgi:hypothetical protein
MNNLEMRETLIRTVTAYDEKQQVSAMRNRRRYYNPHALRLYLEAIDRAFNCPVFPQSTQRQIVLSAFCGQLLDVCLKALGMEKSTDAEQRMEW